MSIKDISNRVHSERQLKAVTGLSIQQFLIIVKIFNEFLIEQKEENKVNKIKPNNGNKGELETAEDKLLFIMHYLKCYPTFDQLGFMFNMNGSNAHTLLYKLIPVLVKTLAHLKVLPKTSFSTPEELREAFKDIDTLIIDATERAIQRPQDNEEQEDHYSGKKCKHTYKNTVIASLGFSILYLGLTFPGKNHDFGMFKKEFDPSLDWFSIFDIYIDLGYAGFDKNYQTNNTFIPHKKPKKSKNNPNPQLTKIQKDENREMSRKRVAVENVIGGMKRFRCLVEKFRNHIPNIKDIVILITAGIWNFNIDNRKI
jgi:CRISPR/Cas system-associated protein endoribonuclease Cas2